MEKEILFSIVIKMDSSDSMDSDMIYEPDSDFNIEPDTVIPILWEDDDDNESVHSNQSIESNQSNESNQSSKRRAKANPLLSEAMYQRWLKRQPREDSEQLRMQWISQQPMVVQFIQKANRVKQQWSLKSFKQHKKSVHKDKQEKIVRPTQQLSNLNEKRKRKVVEHQE